MPKYRLIICEDEGLTKNFWGFIPLDLRKKYFLCPHCKKNHLIKKCLHCHKNHFIKKLDNNREDKK
jgi:hypothetical protein